MKRLRSAVLGVLLALWGGGAVAGDDPPPQPAAVERHDSDDGPQRARDTARRADAGGVDCLNARDARRAVVEKRAVRLMQALRTARDAWDGEVIDYRLCTYDGRLAYDLTLLAADGRVARVRVAADGKLIGVR